MIDAYALWIGKAVMLCGAAAIFAAAITGAAYAINYAVRQALDCYGGWEVFLEYRDWYHKNKKDEQP